MNNVAELIGKTKGKIFSCYYTKGDGTSRKVVARTGVKKGLTGTGRAKPLPENLVSVWDVQNKGYRSLDVSRVSQFKCGDLK